MTLENLKDLYVAELKDLYSAENQILKALPKMVEAASTPQLKSAFSKHLGETEKQVERLESIIYCGLSLNHYRYQRGYLQR